MVCQLVGLTGHAHGFFRLRTSLNTVVGEHLVGSLLGAQGAANALQLFEGVHGRFPNLSLRASNQLEGNQCALGVFVEREEPHGVAHRLGGASRATSRVVERSDARGDIDVASRSSSGPRAASCSEVEASVSDRSTIALA